MTPRDMKPIHRLLSMDPANADLLDGIDEELAAVLDAAADQLLDVRPPPALRERLLRSASPYASFTDRVAELFHVSVEVARRYLADVGRQVGWQAFEPGCDLMHVAGGPAMAGADVGFVRVADGVAFPRHVHHGEERNLVLAGALIDADGERYEAGDDFLCEAGSDHAFRAEGELIFAVVVFGVEFDAALQARLHG